jgi:hypothetical protein
MHSSSGSTASREQVPMVALLLAAAGAFPLTTIAGMIATGVAIPGLDNRFALMSYGAIALAFLGAVHWGLAMSRHVSGEPRSWGTRSQWRSYTVSMAPGLVAWVALLVPERFGVWLLVAGFSGLIVYDRFCLRIGEAPPWLLRLRLPLAATAIGSLIVGIVLVRS